jgi:hypothetical protein
MAYEGEVLYFCPPPHMFDFTRTSAVVVSGDVPNKWGHMLLNHRRGGRNVFPDRGSHRSAPLYE